MEGPKGGAGKHLHEVFKKRRELRQEFKETVGKSWHEGKSEDLKNATPEGANLTALRDSIERGEVISLNEGLQDPKNERASHLTHTLRTLDREAGEFKAEDRGVLEAVARPDHRVEAQDRDFEKRYEKVSSEMTRLRAVHDEMDRKEFALIRERRSNLSSVDLDLIKQYQGVRDAVALREARLRTEPETSTPARMYQLRTYREGLSKDHYAMTPSRQKYEDDIRQLWEENKAVLATGPTGTGKTEMLKHLTKRLYGRDPEILRGSERTGPPDIFGKMLLRATPEGGTETYFQPGRYTAAIDADVPFIADEFNMVDLKVRFQFKELYNRRAGDDVVIQEDTGKSHKIGSRFAIAATANLKNDKYKERFELDPAESRVFEMRRIDYLPKDELYDLCLATLMDSKGRVHASRTDATETLKRLSEATEQIQQAFLGVGSFYEEGSAGTKKKWVLEKAVLDPGKVLSMLGGWQATEARGGAFDEYLNDQLRDFINKEDFPEKDRALLLKVFLAKGFFAGRDAKEFHTNLTPAQLRTYGLKEKRGAVEAHVNPLRPSEVAFLDPFEKRAAELARIGQEFLEDEYERIPYTEDGKEYKLGALLIGEGGRVFRYVGINKEGKPGLMPYEGRVAGSPEKNEAFEGVMERERTRLRDFFGTDIDVPALPDSITPEQYEKWQEMKFELHYLPPEEMRDNKKYPGWKKKPGKKYTPKKEWGIEFLDEAATSQNGLTPDNLKLPGAWILVDTREKPAYKDGNQDFPDDGDIASALKELREKGIIPNYKKADSRFNISWDELHKPETLAKLAEVLGVEPSQVRLPRAAEWNFLGNAHYQKWGDTNTWEWFEDSYQGSWRLLGGDSDDGGLSGVSWGASGRRHDLSGFRPLIVFP
jgi:energy-coupling factor transporter ATP-binding protein EcfA2